MISGLTPPFVVQEPATLLCPLPNWKGSCHWGRAPAALFARWRCRSLVGTPTWPVLLVGWLLAAASQLTGRLVGIICCTAQGSQQIVARKGAATVTGAQMALTAQGRPRAQGIALGACDFPHYSARAVFWMDGFSAVAQCLLLLVSGLRVASLADHAGTALASPDGEVCILRLWPLTMPGCVCCILDVKVRAATT